jgi:hypothetical protein
MALRQVQDQNDDYLPQYSDLMKHLQYLRSGQQGFGGGNA